MNGDFEKSGTYPFAVAPANGWGHDNPTGEYVITYIPILGKAAQVNADSPRDCTLVDLEFATRYPDAVAATRAAAVLTGK